MTERHRTHPYLRKRWTQVGRKLAFSCESRTEAALWRSKTIRKLKQLTGYDTMLSVDLAPRITDEVVFDEYVRQRVEIQTEPGVVMPVFVLIPRDLPSPYAAVLAAHGHSSGGKLAVAGCREIPEVAETIDQHNYDYGVQFARSGFITFCPDARGFGERQEKAAEGSILNSSCQWINNMSFPLGQTVTGMWAWERSAPAEPSGGADLHDAAGRSGGGRPLLCRRQEARHHPRVLCPALHGSLSKDLPQGRRDEVHRRRGRPHRHRQMHQTVQEVPVPEWTRDW